MEMHGDLNKYFKIENVNVVEEINYDFGITVSPTKNYLEVNFMYNEGIYDSLLIKNLTKHF